MYLKQFFLIVIISFVGFEGFAQKTISDYKYEDYNFQGQYAKIVFPEKPNENMNWIWRARFWNHQPQVDIALLEKGFHLVYIDVVGMYGNETAVNLWTDFYFFIKNEFNLNEKVVLEGMSRGGIIVYNWASKNTEKVSCIYVDAPVCDLKSWPGGLYEGVGSIMDWYMCMNAYGLDEESILKFKNMPIYNCEIIATAKIPVLHVCGDKDKYVPLKENTAIVEKRIKELGGNIKVIIKKDIGHHPHSLKNPKPIVDFIIKNSK